MHERIQDILDRAEVAYQVHLHQKLSTPIRSPQDFADALGYEVARITKTLLLQSTAQDQFCLVVVSSSQRVNFDRIAEILKVKRVQMTNQQTLARVLAYPPTGVSPIGAGAIPVLIDAQLTRFPTILIGGGEVGCEIEIAPEVLQQFTKGTVTSVVLLPH